MNGESRGGVDSHLSVQFGSGRADEKEPQRGRKTTRGGAADLDLLRLSYVCRADALLCGMPGRSAALARIHRFFDRAPREAALDDLLLSALLEPACGGHDAS